MPELRSAGPDPRRSPVPAARRGRPLGVERSSSEADLPRVGTFGRQAEAAIKSSYAIIEGTKKTLTREFGFEVPPGTKRVVSFNYAQLWQHGVARLRSGDGVVAEIPFKVAVDMTVNLPQRDTTE